MKRPHCPSCEEERNMKIVIGILILCALLGGAYLYFAPKYFAGYDDGDEFVPEEEKEDDGNP